MSGDSLMQVVCLNRTAAYSNFTGNYLLPGMTLSPVLNSETNFRYTKLICNTNKACEQLDNILLCLIHCVLSLQDRGNQGLSVTIPRKTSSLQKLKSVDWQLATVMPWRRSTILSAFALEKKHHFVCVCLCLRWKILPIRRMLPIPLTTLPFCIAPNWLYFPQPPPGRSAPCRYWRGI